MDLLNIITPVSRPHNLNLLKKSILTEVSPYFHIKWHCIYDEGKNIEITESKESWIVSRYGGIANDCAGGSQRNSALDIITDGWIYCLDDDNIIHQDFGKNIHTLIKDNPSAQGILFNQRRYNGLFDLLAKEENIRIGHVDIAQFIFTKEISDSIRFQENFYQSDCDFILRILLKAYAVDKNQILFVNEFLAHYNYLTK